jgi:rRNA maturation protein Nop10
VNENTRIFVGKSEALDCQTCKSRTYVDGSDEGNVSFKSPAHISPEASYAKVTSHEQEHVANAIRKGSEPGAKLISASVTLKTDICPECGKSYIAGGETFTQIKYNVNNPYEKSRKSLDESMLKGMNFDAVA